MGGWGGRGFFSFLVFLNVFTLLLSRNDSNYYILKSEVVSLN